MSDPIDNPEREEFMRAHAAGRAAPSHSAGPKRFDMSPDGSKALKAFYAFLMFIAFLGVLLVVASALMPTP